MGTQLNQRMLEHVNGGMLQRSEKCSVFYIVSEQIYKPKSIKNTSIKVWFAHKEGEGGTKKRIVAPFW